MSKTGIPSGAPDPRPRIALEWSALAGENLEIVRTFARQPTAFEQPAQQRVAQPGHPPRRRQRSTDVRLRRVPELLDEKPMYRQKLRQAASAEVVEMLEVDAEADPGRARHFDL